MSMCDIRLFNFLELEKKDEDMEEDIYGDGECFKKLTLTDNIFKVSFSCFPIIIEKCYM